tara:strand:+ start:84 stop:485 length:402 start_codon:yes stop_codon:yes gene_type:complete
MKKFFLFFLIILFSISAYSQVDYNKIIKSKYVDFFNFDYSTGDYTATESDWLDVTLDPFEDYYLVDINNEQTKIWWEYEENDTELGDVYYTKDDRKIIFNYKKQEIYFYFSYNEDKNRYEDIMVVSKLEAFDK